MAPALIVMDAAITDMSLLPHKKHNKNTRTKNIELRPYRRLSLRGRLQLLYYVYVLLVALYFI